MADRLSLQQWPDDGDESAPMLDGGAEDSGGEDWRRTRDLSEAHAAESSRDIPLYFNPPFVPSTRAPRWLFMALGAVVLMGVVYATVDSASTVLAAVDPGGGDLHEPMAALNHDDLPGSVTTSVFSATELEAARVMMMREAAVPNAPKVTVSSAIIFPLAIEAIAAGTAARTAFEDGFRASMASKLGGGGVFQADEIVIDSVQAGSVEVQFHVEAPAAARSQAASMFTTLAASSDTIQVSNPAAAGGSVISAVDASGLAPPLVRAVGRSAPPSPTPGAATPVAPKPEPEPEPVPEPAAPPPPVAPVASSTEVDLINSQFRGGGQSTSEVATAGVVVHQFGGSMHEDPQKWLPCPTDQWCADLSDRICCSLISAQSPPPVCISGTQSPCAPWSADRQIGLFSHVKGGFVFAPERMQLQCAYPGDGNTAHRVCLDLAAQPLDPGQPCVGGCGCLSKGEDTEPVPCDNTCPSPSPAPPHHQCMWPAAQLSSMLENQRTPGAEGNGPYNELVFDAATMTASLPGSVQAIFFPKSCGPDCEARTRCVHAAFVAEYPEAVATTPLLVLDVTNWAEPFARAPTVSPLAVCSGPESDALARLCRQACAAVVTDWTEGTVEPEPAEVTPAPSPPVAPVPAPPPSGGGGGGGGGDVCAQMNDRFQAGSASAMDLQSAGILTHQFDFEVAGNLYAPGPGPCNAKPGGWCAVEDRVSCSLINAAVSTQNGVINLYISPPESSEPNVQPGGVILAPSHNRVNCMFSQDGGTYNRLDGGCGCPTVAALPCNSSCAAVHPDGSQCAWPPTAVSEMLNGMDQQCGTSDPSCTYNELVLDPSTWTQNLPHSIEAFFYPQSDQCDSACVQKAQTAHTQFTTRFPDSGVPLLMLDVHGGDRPFSVHGSVDESTTPAAEPTDVDAGPVFAPVICPSSPPVADALPCAEAEYDPVTATTCHVSPSCSCSATCSGHFNPSICGEMSNCCDSPCLDGFSSNTRSARYICGSTGRWTWAATTGRSVPLVCTAVANSTGYTPSGGEPGDSPTEITDPTTSAGTGGSDGQTTVDRINQRFVSGRASNEVAAAGVVIHQFDATSDPEGEKWMPCPKTCYGGTPCWCATFGDRFSASLVSAQSPPADCSEVGACYADPADRQFGIFKDTSGAYNGGFVLAPQELNLLCSYPGDGGTMTRFCLNFAGEPLYPGQACVAGCGCQADEGMPCENSCAAPAPSPAHRDHQCAWPADNLAEMLGYQGGTYNELVLDTEAWVANLPGSIEAVFYPAACGEACVAAARATHAAFIARYPEAAATTPLLALDVTDWDMPFSWV